jgi:subtilisin family serine protease
VASAGNDGQATEVWPASYSNVMGIASTNNQKIRSLFSNYGNPLVTLAAPGEGIITLYPREHYAQVWGTSFSAPMVSGAAALLLDMNSKTDEGMAVSALSNATAIGQELGAGELDLYQAVLAAKKK